MESNINNRSLPFHNIDKNRLDKQVKIIKQASELAQSRIDYHTAHDDHIVRAIEIVESFLRKRHRLCYGGQAINAHLPDKYKFYDPEYSIPDYDFFTPNQDADITMIVNDLKKAGFNEISAREGMHEGTIKIYVEYTPVADITAIDPYLYRILSKREYRVDGISYMDANTLRMLMYLELSRPRGEVERWPKVYERLLLFNEFASKKSCHIKKDILYGSLTNKQVEFTLQYIIQNKRIFAGADLFEFYKQSLRKSSKYLNWIVSSKKPILFYSDEPDKDAEQLRSEFQIIDKIENKSGSVLKIKTISSKGGELLPHMKIIYHGKNALVFIIHQTACHSYFNVPLLIEHRKENMRIASLDTLITLYFSLGLVRSSFFDMESMECLASQLVQISIKARNKGDHYIFPFISLTCSGHQTTLPSLIRSKVQRITSKREKTKQTEKNKNYETKKNRNRNTIRNTIRNFNKIL
jgi:hypothetical protein